MTSLLAAARSGGAATASGRCGSTAARTGVVPRATLGAGASLHTAAAKVVPVSALGVVGGSSSSGPALSLVGAAAAGGVVLPASSMSGGSVATSAAAAAVSAQTAVLARATAATNAVVELDAESFYSYLDANSQSLVVVDFFTDCERARRHRSLPLSFGPKDWPLEVAGGIGEWAGLCPCVCVGGGRVHACTQQRRGRLDHQH